MVIAQTRVQPRNGMTNVLTCILIFLPVYTHKKKRIRKETVDTWHLATYNIFCLLHLATNWSSGEDDHVVARAEYDFSAASEEEISLRAGDLINLAPKGESSLLSFSVNLSGLFFV